MGKTSIERLERRGRKKAVRMGSGPPKVLISKIFFPYFRLLEPFGAYKWARTLIFSKLIAPRVTL